MKNCFIYFKIIFYNLLNILFLILNITCIWLYSIFYIYLSLSLSLSLSTSKYNHPPTIKIIHRYYYQYSFLNQNL